MSDWCKYAAGLQSCCFASGGSQVLCKSSLIFHLNWLYVVLVTSSLGMNQSFEMRFKKPDLYDTMINGIYTLSHTQVILSHVALSEVDTLE